MICDEFNNKDSKKRIIFQKNFKLQITSAEVNNKVEYL